MTSIIKNRMVSPLLSRTREETNTIAIEINSTIVVIIRFLSIIFLHCDLGPERKHDLPIYNEWFFIGYYLKICGYLRENGHHGSQGVYDWKFISINNSEERES